MNVLRLNQAIYQCRNHNNCIIESAGCLELDKAETHESLFSLRGHLTLLTACTN